jgi:hypothetical protein
MTSSHGHAEKTSLEIISERGYRGAVQGRRTAMTIIAITTIVAIVCLGLLAGVAATEVLTA